MSSEASRTTATFSIASLHPHSQKTAHQAKGNIGDEYLRLGLRLQSTAGELQQLRSCFGSSVEKARL